MRYATSAVAAAPPLAGTAPTRTVHCSYGSQFKPTIGVTRGSSSIWLIAATPKLTKKFLLGR
jgi:hypothetical protein